MTRYAKNCRIAYDEIKLSAEEMIRQVYHEAEARSTNTKEHQQLAVRGIRALFELTSNAAHEKSFSIRVIYQQAGIDPEQTPTSGLWVWDDVHGCGVVGKAEGKRQYWIKHEFLNPLHKVIEMTNDE